MTTGDLSLSNRIATCSCLHLLSEGENVVGYFGEYEVVEKPA
jgi:hypothetical protein